MTAVYQSMLLIGGLLVIGVRLFRAVDRAETNYLVWQPSLFTSVYVCVCVCVCLCVSESAHSRGQPRGQSHLQVSF